MNPVFFNLYCPTLAIFGDIGGGEVMVVLAAILVLFGGKGLPGMARTLGKITRDLQRASQDFKDQLLSADLEEPAPFDPTSSEWGNPPPANYSPESGEPEEHAESSTEAPDSQNPADTPLAAEVNDIDQKDTAPETDATDRKPVLPEPSSSDLNG
jgi:sec-independent protein translocase protein TatA